MSLFYLLIFFLSNLSFAENIEVNSIQIEGNSVIEDETILSYIPFKSETNLSEDKQNQIIESLYSTGFFNDILLIIEDDILYVRVKERPVISSINFDGEKSISEEELNAALSSVKISEGQIFNDITLDKDGILVVMCTWKRLKYLKNTINMLEKQNIKQKINLFIWNNNFKDKLFFTNINSNIINIAVWIY